MYFIKMNSITILTRLVLFDMTGNKHLNEIQRNIILW